MNRYRAEVLPNGLIRIFDYVATTSTLFTPSGGMYYVYFRGTRNGEHLQAENLKSAKWMFALKHGLQSITYIAGRKIK